MRWADRDQPTPSTCVDLAVRIVTAARSDVIPRSVPTRASWVGEGRGLNRTDIRKPPPSMNV